MVCHGKIHRHLKSPLEAGIYPPPPHPHPANPQKPSSALSSGIFSLLHEQGSKLQFNMQLSEGRSFISYGREASGRVHGNQMSTRTHAFFICFFFLLLQLPIANSQPAQQLSDEPEKPERSATYARTKMGMGVNLRASHYRKPLVTHSIGLRPLPLRESFVLSEKQRAVTGFLPLGCRE